MPIPDNMAMTAKKYTTVGIFSLLDTADICPVSTVTSGGSGSVAESRFASCAGEGTYFTETSHRRTQTSAPPSAAPVQPKARATAGKNRSEEHTSELQSRGHLVCRLLLEKK